MADSNYVDEKYLNEKKDGDVKEAPFDGAESGPGYPSGRRESIRIIEDLVAEDHSHAISLRTMSWQKAAWLLAGDQVCLAIMAQTWSLSVLGWVPGIITMVAWREMPQDQWILAAKPSFALDGYHIKAQHPSFTTKERTLTLSHILGAGILFWFTSITMHKFIMKYPEIQNICDFGYYAFGKSRIAYEFTGFMLLANNILLIGFHVLTGAKVMNTLSDHSLCTVDFSVIAMIMGIVMSIPRTLKHVSFMSMFSAFFMGLAILLFLVFAGIENAPLYGYYGDYPTDGPVHTYAFPLPGTTWVGCMNAVLNITFLWVPQILFPTFISEMERPQDFPKALAVLTAISAFLFIVPPAIGFHYLGQYSTAPAFGSLGVTAYKKGSFAFVIVPTIVIGVIYANVSAKFIYARIMGNSHHAHSNTVIGWGVWAAVMAGIWLIAFIFAEIIPSMGDFLSLLGAAFDSFFGFIFFAVAYWHLYRGNYFGGVSRSLMTVLHIFVMIVGLFLLGPGLYAAVEAIIADYSGSTTPAFSCSNVAI